MDKKMCVCDNLVSWTEKFLEEGFRSVWTLMQIRIAQVHGLLWSVSVPHSRCSDQCGLRQNSPLHQGGLINCIEFYLAKYDDNKRNVLKSKEMLSVK